METQRTVRLLIVLVFAVGALHAVAQMAPFEDAYITYRYSEHLATGLGLVYNAGERVEGCSSLAWTGVLAAVAKLGLPLGPASQLLAMAGGLMLVWTTLGLSCALVAKHPLDSWQILPAAAVIASGTWAYYAGSGMETTTFAALVTGAARLAIAERDRRRALAAGFVFGLAAMTRPEGAGYVLAVLAAILWGRDRRDALTLSMSFSALFVPFFCARWWYFGYPLPNTYYAKAAPSLSLFKAGAVHAEAFLTSQAFWLPLIAAVGLGIACRHERGWRILAAVVLAALVNAVLVGGDTFAYFRLFLPAIPCGAVALVATARALSARWLPRRTELAGASFLTAWVVFTFSAQFLPMRTILNRRPLSEWQRVAAVARINADDFVVGAWLREQFDAKTLLAVNAAGIVPYVSRLRTLDMLGLNDEHIAHHRQRLGQGVIGHEKYDAKYVLSRRPDIILLGLPVLAKRPAGPGELERWFGRWFPYLPGDRELFHSEDFRRAYTPVSVAIGAKYLVFFLRNRSAS